MLHRVVFALQGASFTRQMQLYGNQALAEKQSISMIQLCSIQNICSSPFLSLEYDLGMFLSFDYFAASCSYEIGSYKKGLYEN